MQVLLLLTRIGTDTSAVPDRGTDFSIGIYHKIMFYFSVFSLSFCFYILHLYAVS